MEDLWGERHLYPSPYTFDLLPMFPIKIHLKKQNKKEVFLEGRVRFGGFGCPSTVILQQSFPSSFLLSSHLPFCFLSREENLLICLFRTKDMRILTVLYFRAGLFCQNPGEDALVHPPPGVNPSRAHSLEAADCPFSPHHLARPLSHLVKSVSR